MDETRCPKCASPVQEEKSGSLTQWVKRCLCDQKLKEEEFYRTLRICKLCGKKISLARHGSMTQWIFRTNLCSCDKPVVEKADGEKGKTQQSTTVDYPELAELKTDFPLDRFKPIELLGSGASGIVYRSQDRKLRKIVAVKVLKHFNPKEVVSFQDEAKITAKLKHQNIIGISDINSTSDGAPYMVLEYVAGVNLRQYLDFTGNLSCKLTIEIAIQICDALGYAHEKDIYHRDLKPANILLAKNKDGSPLVKIIDFGIAKVIQQEENRFEYQGKTIVGTPRYMSPDQAQGKTFDSRAEIYSLGCILYEMLAGRPPFVSENVLEILAMHAMEDPPSLELSEDNSADSSALEKLVIKCLAKEPEYRYQSISTIKEDLKTCLVGRINSVQELGAKHDRRLNKHRALFAFAIFLVLLTGLVSFALMNIDSSADEKASLQSINTPISYEQTIHKRDDLGFFVRDPNSEFLHATKLADDDSLRVIKGRQDVALLDLSHTMIEGRGLVYLEGMPIKYLKLDRTGITDEDILSLAKIPTLELLSMNKTRITGKNLDKLQNLTALEIGLTDLNDQGLLAISQIKKLKSLRFSSKYITRKGVSYLRTNRQFETMGLMGNHDFSAILPELKKINSLHTFAFERRKLKVSDILFVRETSVKKLFLGGCWFDDAVIEELAKCKNLSNIYIWSNKTDPRLIRKLPVLMKDCKIVFDFPSE